MRKVVIRKGRSKPLWHGHPWVFAESVAAVEEDGGPSGEKDVARVVDEQGRTVGQGLLSERSAIRVRLLARGAQMQDVQTLLARRVGEAVALRRRLFPEPARTNAYRLVHSEGDDLPGLVVDRWADLLVAQFATAPMHRRRDALARTLLEATGARGLVARPGGYEEEEGIPPADVAFQVGEVPERVSIVEEGMRLEIDAVRGQKTGHYADQRENRLAVAALAQGTEVLDLYAGTGGFAVQALRAGARRAHAVESSPRACEAARRNGAINDVADRIEVACEDVRLALPALKQAQRQFDVVVLDPPNLFPRRGNPAPALRAHRDLNVQALVRVAPRGFLATFTCSGRLPPEAFRELVASAATECRRSLRILRELGAGPDHPFPVAASEGRYLSGLLVQVTG